MGAFVGLAGKALKAVLKIALFCGLAWFLIPFVVWFATELITGKYLEQVFKAEIEARRVLDSALKEQIQDREHEKTKVKGRGRTD